MEPVERFHDPGSQLAAVVAPEGDAQDLETISIVQLEKFGRNGRDHMLTEVCGQICDPKPVVRSAPAADEGLLGAKTFVARE
jgi:hypothetical protein